MVTIDYLNTHGNLLHLVGTVAETQAIAKCGDKAQNQLYQEPSQVTPLGAAGVQEKRSNTVC